MQRAAIRGVVLVLKVVVMLVLAVGIAGIAYATVLAPGPAAIPTPASRGAASAAPQPTGEGEVTVRLDEATLTQQLNARMAGKPIGDTPLGAATARDLQVRLRGGQMQATGTARVGGADVPIAVTGTVEAQDGRAVARVTDARVGGVPLPDGVRAQVEQSIQSQLDQAVQGRGMRVRTVSLEEGSLTFVGSRS